ncbi:hypothetical protein CI109_102843 [Kwoniella shandongensis]|uniref:Mitochondrial zinc maintenance protein 1, mitochondrial n=1 Tax=Kwoniella shandongensis TaxID=1734106 RepID=A0A5M6CCN2_9TREE|nr:uncharacterized protein CI109_000033 [Kwoniella shandongensis]KAA5531195.1 hypothetical protein CI109_000033 [Kwoniella shandongensis]
MSFPASLAPAARSAYRSVLRSARVTFQGDPARHLALITALRSTFSSPTLTPPTSQTTTDQPIGEAEISKRIEEWKEAAVFLRKNVVQGEETGDGTWKLRVTKDTELGDNASIRDPPKLPTTPFPNRNKRRCGDAASKQAS